LFYYLFAVIDLYSRKLAAWEVHERESRDEAAILIERACWREHLRGRPLILHADNGAAQKAYTLKAKLEALGITPSHSRPGVSDENPPHIEFMVPDGEVYAGLDLRFADARLLEPRAVEHLARSTF